MPDSNAPNKIKRQPGYFDVGELTQEQRHQRDLASHAYEQDLFKHVASLSTGAVVILVTFLEKLRGVPHWRPLIGVSLGAFGLSVLALVGMQLLSVNNVSKEPDAELSTRGVIGFLLIVIAGFGGFAVGLTCLILFGIKNF